MSSDSPSTRKWWVGGWLAAILAAAGTLVWCLLIYFLLKDRPRDWQYGVTPYVPGQSAFSTQARPAGVTPKQVVLPQKNTGGANAKPVGHSLPGRPMKNAPLAPGRDERRSA